MSKQRPQFIIEGNFLSSQPKPPGHEQRIKALAEDIAIVNSLQYWHELYWFEKLWLIVSYPFRRKNNG